MDNLTALYSTDDIPYSFQNVSGYSDHGEAMKHKAPGAHQWLMQA
jgi:hypothetical protein